MNRILPEQLQFNIIKLQITLEHLFLISWSVEPAIVWEIVACHYEG